MKPRAASSTSWISALTFTLLVFSFSSELAARPSPTPPPHPSAASAEKRPETASPGSDDETAPPLLPVSAFDNAINAFKYQDFDKAIKRLRALLYPRSLLKRRQEWRAREYLGASLWWTSAKQASLDEFTALLVRNPQTRLDPTFYPPEMINDFEQLRLNLMRLGVIQPGQKPAPAKLDGRLLRAPRALTWVPFGVGQIANNEPIKGLAIMLSEAALLGTSWAFFELNRGDGLRGQQSTSRQIWQVSTGAGFWLIAALGVVDAVLVRADQDHERETVPR